MLVITAAIATYSCIDHGGDMLAPPARCESTMRYSGVVVYGTKGNCRFPQKGNRLAASPDTGRGWRRAARHIKSHTGVKTPVKPTLVCHARQGARCVGEGAVRTVQEYREYAESCRVLAARLTDPKDKLALELMARAWDKAATDREKTLTDIIE